MELSIQILAGLLLVMAFATYFQTVTGFGLSIIVIGVTSGLDLVPLALAASVVSLVSLSNCAMAISLSSAKNLPWRFVWLILLGAVPASIVGVILLEYLSREAAAWLQLALGIVIVISGIQSALKPHPLVRESKGTRLAVNGVVAGLSGGLFGMPGPPIVFLMYRQPLDLDVVRQVLLIVFFLISLFRMAYLGVFEGFDTDSYVSALFSLPLIAVMTRIGKKYPPPIPAEVIRRLTFMILVTIGIGLIFSSSIDLIHPTALSK